MEKVELRTADIAAENAAKLAELFPDIVTEVLDEDGNVRHSIDVEALKAHVGDIAEDKRERYQFTWPGKQKARAEAIRAIDKTMRPCSEESVSWDTTENLYIEGDNLDALKILRETYAGKIKMIYIDPPYNTGHDFVYNDTFARTAEEERAESGAFDEDGNALDPAFKANGETNGRFHSDWCSMMYPRLLLAVDLLDDDGFLFASIDDNEVTNFTKIADEVFGVQNRIALICHKSRASVSNDKIISPNHNTILFYCKNREVVEAMRKQIGLDPVLEGFDKNDCDGRGNYKLVPVDGPGGAKKGNPYYSFLGVEGYWRFSESTMATMYDEGLIVKAGNSLYQKYYLSKAESSRKTTTTWWEDAGYTSNATSKLKALMGNSLFDNPKPLPLIDRQLRMVTHFAKSSIVLDFFSGSATTAHAVMQLNAEDGGNRKFIMVQLPEVCDEKSEAAKAGYKNICEIGKERIRRAGAKIAAEVEESNAQLKLGEEPKRMPDIGFRVLKIDSSNFEDVQRTPDTLCQDALFSLADNVKPGRTSEDILFQLFPKLEIPYTARIDKLDICGKTVYSVDDDTLLACFDREVPEDVVRAMAQREPAWAVLRDASFAGDDALANFEEIFKTVSPETKTRVV